MILDNQIIQPLKQLFREGYFKQDDELQTSSTYRYSGQLIKIKTAFAFLSSRGWHTGYDSIYKLFPDQKLRVEL